MKNLSLLSLLGLALLLSSSNAALAGPKIISLPNVTAPDLHWNCGPKASYRVLLYKLDTTQENSTIKYPTYEDSCPKGIDTTATLLLEEMTPFVTSSLKAAFVELKGFAKGMPVIQTGAGPYALATNMNQYIDTTHTLFAVETSTDGIADLVRAIDNTNPVITLIKIPTPSATSIPFWFVIASLLKNDIDAMNELTILKSRGLTLLPSDIPSLELKIPLYDYVVVNGYETVNNKTTIYYVDQTNKQNQTTATEFDKMWNFKSEPNFLGKALSIDGVEGRKMILSQ